MSEREVTNLIFLPGFSTAEKVTNVSGRGVGMDVVKTNIEKIGGTVDVQSKPGAGTTVRMKIPLTLAIIPALIVTSAATATPSRRSVCSNWSAWKENRRARALNGSTARRCTGCAASLLPLAI
jgi:hypothetical protein